MIKFNAQEWLIHRLIYKGWKRKVDPEQIAAKITEKSGYNSLTVAQITQIYEFFAAGKLGFFMIPAWMRVASTRQEIPQTFIDSIVQVNRDMCFILETHTKDGRFLAWNNFDAGPRSIIVHDLFRGTKKTNSVSFLTIYTSFNFIGNYLLATRRPQNSDLLCFHLLKVNCAHLTVEELNEIEVEADFYYSNILVDQLDTQKFVIYGSENILMGQIQNEKIVVDNVKTPINFKTSWGTRFVGGKLQGFEYDGDNILDSMRFCELNLKTMKETGINVPINLGNDELEITFRMPPTHCWSNERFYTFAEMKNHQQQSLSSDPHQLFVFNPETLKWSDVQILANHLKTMFVDENEFLTVQVGNHPNKSCALYRIGLRKPDTLKNLTFLTAVREEKLYGNEKYVNVSSQILFTL